MGERSSKIKELIFRFKPGGKYAAAAKKIIGIIWWVLIIGLALLMISIIGAKLRGEVPKIAGYSIMKIISGSMEDEIPEDSYILIREIDPAEVGEGDIITFYSSDYMIYGLPNTHRVVESPIVTDGGIEFVTKGDANPINDKVTAKGEDLIGIYVRRLDGLTNFAKALEGGGMFIIMIVLEAFIFAMAAMMFLKNKKMQLEKEKEDDAHEREKSN